MKPLQNGIDLEVLIVRETTSVYTTSLSRAAYRAGMSTSFAICDYVAKEFGTRTQITRAQAESATRCGDMIEILRSGVQVKTPVPMRPPLPGKSDEALRLRAAQMERMIRRLVTCADDPQLLALAVRDARRLVKI
jgi:hypothetical protein